MEQETKGARERLFGRLDECLVWNANLKMERIAGRSARKAIPRDLNDLYELGNLIERHRYLKNVHSFEPGEAEALLCFDDPLGVAQSCWEEKGAAGFPICKILNDIGAYERFPLTSEEEMRRSEPQIHQLEEQLKERLDQNLAAYTTALMGKSKLELMEGSEAITNTRAAYAYMRNSYVYTYNEIDVLLKLDDPLHYLASRWSMTLDLYGDDDGIIEESILDLLDPETFRRAQEAAAPAQGDKPSVLDQLHKTAQEMPPRPPGEHRPRDTDPR